MPGAARHLRLSFTPRALHISRYRTLSLGISAKRQTKPQNSSDDGSRTHTTGATMGTGRTKLILGLWHLWLTKKVGVNHHAQHGLGVSECVPSGCGSHARARGAKAEAGGHLRSRRQGVSRSGTTTTPPAARWVCTVTAGPFTCTATGWLTLTTTRASNPRPSSTSPRCRNSLRRLRSKC